MTRFLAATAILFAFSGSASALTFQLCNKYGISPVAVTAWDRKAGNAMIFNGTVPKDGCSSASASGGAGGDYADISLKVGTGNPYGVSFIKAGDQVNF